MATILRTPLVSERQQKRAIAAVDYFSRPLTLGINPNASVAQLFDSAPASVRRIQLDVYPNLLGTTLGAVAPATLDLPLRSGRVFESAPRKRWQADPISAQGFIIYDGPEAAIASIFDSAPPRKKSAYAFDPPNLLVDTLWNTTQMTLPMAAAKLSDSAPPPKYQVRIEALSRPLTLGINPNAAVGTISDSATPRKRPVVFEYPPNRMLLTTTFVSVPNVVGASEASGTSDLNLAGFVVSVQTAYSNTVPVGQIISQSPAAGTQQASGTTVTITVSLGEAPDADQNARAKLLLILRKKKRIKQREDERNG